MRGGMPCEHGQWEAQAVRLLCLRVR